MIKAVINKTNDLPLQDDFMICYSHEKIITLTFLFYLDLYVSLKTSTKAHLIENEKFGSLHKPARKVKSKGKRKSIGKS